MGFENSVADLFSCETSWLGRCVPTVASVNMVRVIRNVLRFNTGKILRFPQKSANWPIPIWCFTTPVAPVFQPTRGKHSFDSLLTCSFIANSFLFFLFSFFFLFFFIRSRRDNTPSRMEHFYETPFRMFHARVSWLIFKSLFRANFRNISNYFQ